MGSVWDMSREILVTDAGEDEDTATIEEAI